MLIFMNMERVPFEPPSLRTCAEIGRNKHMGVSLHSQAQQARRLCDHEDRQAKPGPSQENHVRRSRPASTRA